MTSLQPAATAPDDQPHPGRETRAHPTLSAEVELALCRRWHDRHDLSAAHLLVSASRSSVAKIAAAYALRYGVPRDDLTGEAYVGLMRALCRFDPYGGERFAAYAASRVHAAVQALILRRRSADARTASLERGRLNSAEGMGLLNKTTRKTTRGIGQPSWWGPTLLERLDAEERSARRVRRPYATRGSGETRL